MRPDMSWTHPRAPDPPPLLPADDDVIMIAVRMLMLATLLGVATAADPFGTPGGTPDCSVANRPQLAFPGAYVNVFNVRESPPPPAWFSDSSRCSPSLHPHGVSEKHACLPLRLLQRCV
jgi:hypothetical protein